MQYSYLFIQVLALHFRWTLTQDCSSDKCPFFKSHQRARRAAAPPPPCDSLDVSFLAIDDACACEGKSETAEVGNCWPGSRVSWHLKNESYITLRFRQQTIYFESLYVKCCSCKAKAIILRAFDYYKNQQGNKDEMNVTLTRVNGNDKLKGWYSMTVPYNGDFPRFMTNSDLVTLQYVGQRSHVVSTDDVITQIEFNLDSDSLDEDPNEADSNSAETKSEGKDTEPVEELADDEFAKEMEKERIKLSSMSLVYALKFNCSGLVPTLPSTTATTPTTPTTQKATNATTKPSTTTKPSSTTKPTTTTKTSTATKQTTTTKPATAEPVTKTGTRTTTESPTTTTLKAGTTLPEVATSPVSEAPGTSVAVLVEKTYVVEFRVTSTNYVEPLGDNKTEEYKHLNATFTPLLLSSYTATMHGKLLEIGSLRFRSGSVVVEHNLKVGGALSEEVQELTADYATQRFDANGVKVERASFKFRELGLEWTETDNILMIALVASLLVIVVIILIVVFILVYNQRKHCSGSHAGSSPGSSIIAHEDDFYQQRDLGLGKRSLNGMIWQGYSSMTQPDVGSDYLLGQKKPYYDATPPIVPSQELQKEGYKYARSPSYQSKYSDEPYKPPPYLSKEGRSNYSPPPFRRQISNPSGSGENPAYYRQPPLKQASYEQPEIHRQNSPEMSRQISQQSGYIPRAYINHASQLEDNLDYDYFSNDADQVSKPKNASKYPGEIRKYGGKKMDVPRANFGDAFLPQPSVFTSPDAGPVGDREERTKYRRTNSNEVGSSEGEGRSRAAALPRSNFGPAEGSISEENQSEILQKLYHNRPKVAGYGRGLLFRSSIRRDNSDALHRKSVKKYDNNNLSQQNASTETSSEYPEQTHL